MQDRKRGDDRTLVSIIDRLKNVFSDNKRSQITLFIILGMMLVLVITLLIIFREQISVFVPEEVIPTATGGIRGFVETCGEEVSTEALTLLGAQGGYITLPREIRANRLSHVSKGPGTESIKVPMWVYDQEDRRPSIDTMKVQLNRYVENNMKECIQELEPFQERYDIIEKGLQNNPGTLDVQTELTSEGTIFKIEYPIEIRSSDGEKITELSNFQVENDVNLKEVYNVANEIMDQEQQQAKLEDVTIDLISADPDIPISGIDVGCGERNFGTREEAKQELQESLRYNIPRIRIEKTNYPPIPSDRNYTKNHLVWDVTELPHDDVGASMTLPSTNTNAFNFAVKPLSGNELKSNQMKGQRSASFFCLQMWQFTYDVDYPVIVSVEDKETNFNFQYSFMVRVRDNRQSRDDITETPSQFNNIKETEKDYCQGSRDYPMTIKTKDNISKTPVPNANITFTCLKYSCKVGETSYSSQEGVRGQSVLKTDLPYCSNAIIKANKGGNNVKYKEGTTTVSTTKGGEATVYLTPVKEFNYTIVKHTINEEGTVSPSKQLSSEEQALVTIEKINGSHNTRSTFGASREAKNPITLLARDQFKYDLEIKLIEENGDIKGGYENNNWNPRWNKLDQNNKIVFHTIVNETATGEQRYRFYNNLEEHSEEISKPQLKTE